MSIFKDNNLTLFPRVTYSRNEFLDNATRICLELPVNDEKGYEWINDMNDFVCSEEGVYFHNWIYLNHPSAYILLHEYIHHVTLLLFYITHFLKLQEIDVLNDSLSAMLSKLKWKMGKLLF
jgi:hypothetical protein